MLRYAKPCHAMLCCAILCCAGAGKQRAEHKVREADSAETVTQQWQALMALLRDNNSAVLYHMENHYCLVFAARSWHVDAGRPTGILWRVGSRLATLLVPYSMPSTHACTPAVRA